MLKDILCWIGLATCEPVQPDVSAHTILNMLIQTEGRAELLLPALGSLYEEVTDFEKQLPDGIQSVTISLRRDDEQKAILKCSRMTAHGAALAALDSNKLWPKNAMLVPFGENKTTRSFCQFTYFDDFEYTQAFEDQGTDWATAQFGKLNTSPPEQKAITFAEATSLNPMPRGVFVTRMAPVAMLMYYQDLP